MRLLKKDCKEVYISFYIGLDLDDKPVYTEPQKVFAQVGDVTAYILSENIGDIPGYDRILQFEVGDMVEYLREDSLLWIDAIPNKQKTNMDYKIEKLGDVVNGIVQLFCSRTTPNTTPIYYCNDGKNIYQVKIIYKDYEAIVPRNMYLPIDCSSLVWYLRPANAESTKGRIVVSDIEELEDVYKITFRKYNG